MTTNQFDFFEGSRTETQAPTVTVRRSGQMVLTPPAVAMLGDEVSHVQFGFDSNTQAVALRAAPNGSKGRYTLRAQSNGGSLVDGRRFLAHHGLKVEKAQRFPAESFGDGMVGFRFPESETEGKGESQSPAKGESQTAAPSEGQTPKGKSARTGKRKATATA
jgi:hypothetical protein